MRTHRLSLICIVAVIAAMLSTLSSQQTFRVYRNDGSMELFFYSTLDSITFSPPEYPELPGDAGFTQTIHTADSVYHFLTSEIDSISFQPLPTVYKPAVVRIEGRLRDYVIGSDSLTLFVHTDIPETLLPKPGVDVATLECDDVLPYGFLGHVETIVRTDASISIECSQVSLLDIFDSLGLEGTSTSDTDEPTPSRGALDVWPPKTYNLVVPSQKRTLSLSNEIKAPGGLSQTYDMSISGEINTDSCQAVWAYLVIPQPNKAPQICWDFTFKLQQTVSVGCSLGSTVKWEKTFPFTKGRNKRLPGVGALIEIIHEGGFFIEIDGELGLNGSYSQPISTYLHMSYDSNNHAMPVPTYRVTRHQTVCESVLEGSASVTAGVYGKIGVAPFAKEIATIEAESKLGATFSSARDLSAGVAPIEILNTETYDNMNRDDFYRVDLSLSGEISATLLGNTKLKGGLEFGDLIFKNPIFKNGAVPRFENVSLTDEGEPGTLTATATLGRKLMFGVPVGFALYDENNKFVDKWWADGEYKNTEGRTISHKFEGLNANTTYTLHPITRAFNEDMVANPSDDEKVTQHIFTGDALNITNSQATLTAKINMDSEREYIAGFYYYETNGVKKQVSTKGKGSKEMTLNISGLQDYTEYHYSAFIHVGENIEEGEEKSFTTCRVDKGIEVSLSSALFDVDSSSIDIHCTISSQTVNKGNVLIYYYEDGGELQVIDIGECPLLYGGLYSIKITDLKANTKYTVYIAVKNGNNIAYSEPQTFRTLRADEYENPIFELIQIPEKTYSSNNYFYNTHKLVKKGSNNSDEYIIHPNHCGVFETTNAKNGISFDEQHQAEYYCYGNYNLTAEFEAKKQYTTIIKYAHQASPDEWYYTKVPMTMTYNHIPKLESITPYYGSINFELDGAFWISALIVEAELWESVPYEDEYGGRYLIDVKRDEQIFEITPSHCNAQYFSDYIRYSAKLWPDNSGYNKVIIKSSSFKLKTE